MCFFEFIMFISLKFYLLTSSGSITSHYSGIEPKLTAIERAAEIEPLFTMLRNSGSLQNRLYGIW